MTTHVRRAVLSVGALWLCAAVVAAAQGAAKGAALMVEARKAVGGEERLRAVTSLDVRGEFKRSTGQNTIEGDLQIRLARPDKLRRDDDMSLPGGGPAVIRTQMLNGSEAWDENTGGQGGRGFGGAFARRGGGGERQGRTDGQAPDTQGRGRAALDPAQIEDALRRARQSELMRLMLVWLLATDAPVTWIGTAEAPDGKADVLEVTPANQPAIRLFLDETSHVPLMITWQGGPAQIAGRRGGRGVAPAAQRMTLGEYKTVHGIRFPHLITRGTSEQTAEEWTIDSYRINPTFRSDVFTK